MPVEVSKQDVWVAEIDDRPGALASRLEGLAAAGVDLQFLIARRQPAMPGKGIVFVSGISGAKAGKAAAAAGFAKTADLTALRLEGPNKPGACHQVTRTLADAGINLRGLSAGVVGSKFLLFMAFDNADDATKAAKLLKASAGKKK
jgi:hypothetical protein